MGKSKTPTKPTTKTPKARRDWRPAFLKSLAADGVVVLACRKAKIHKDTAYEERKRNDGFATAWDEAIELPIGEAEASLFVRGVKGVMKPVYQGGAQVGTVREYDTTALIVYLKAHLPGKYREPRGDINVTVAPPTVPDHVAKAALEAAQLAADGGKDLGPAA